MKKQGLCKRCNEVIDKTHGALYCNTCRTRPWKIQRERANAIYGPLRSEEAKRAFFKQRYAHQKEAIEE